MSKIWIVTDGEYSDYHIVAVFLDEKKAVKYCERNGFEIEEYEDYSDRVDIDPDTKVCFEYLVYRSSAEATRIRVLTYQGRKPESYVGISNLFKSNAYSQNPESRDKFSKAHVILEKDDPELALKIGRDMLAKYDAEIFEV